MEHRVDGVLKNFNPEREYFVIQTVEPWENNDWMTHVNRVRKLTRNLNDMLWSLHCSYGSGVLSERGTQVLGVLEEDSVLSVYGLTNVGYISFLHCHDCVDILDEDGGTKKMVEILKLAQQIRSHLERLCSGLKKLSELDPHERSHNTIFPSGATSEKQTKTSHHNLTQGQKSLKRKRG